MQVRNQLRQVKPFMIAISVLLTLYVGMNSFMSLKETVKLQKKELDLMLNEDLTSSMKMKISQVKRSSHKPWKQIRKTNDVHKVIFTLELVKMAEVLA